MGDAAMKRRPSAETTAADLAGTYTAGARPADINVPGYIGHLPDARTTPDSEAPAAARIAQWCFPARRQQAGSLSSEFAIRAGLNSEKLNRARSRMAETRRKR
jgi:hypothetical protein